VRADPARIAARPTRLAKREDTAVELLARTGSSRIARRRAAWGRRGQAQVCVRVHEARQEVAIRDKGLGAIDVLESDPIVHDVDIASIATR
jgi:hypothetical protein